MKEVKHYEEWLSGQHGGHDSSQIDNWLVCETCQVKFRTGLSPAQIKEALKPLKTHKP